MRSTIANKSQEQLGLSENRVLYLKFCMVNRSIIFSFIFPNEVAISRSHFQTETSGTQGSRTPRILIDRWQLWLVVCQGAKRCTPDTPVQRRAVTGMGTSCCHHDRGCWSYDILLLFIIIYYYYHYYIYMCVCVHPFIVIYSLIFFNNKLGTQSGDWDHARGEKPRTKEDLWP